MADTSVRTLNPEHLYSGPAPSCRMEEQLGAIERREAAGGAGRALSGLAAVNKRNTGQNFTNAFKVRGSASLQASGSKALCALYPRVWCWAAQTFSRRANVSC